MALEEPQRQAANPKMHAKFSALARKDTSPELAVRRALHRAGLRYRVEYRVQGLPRRRVDIAFPRKRVAVFVDGCFWHGCPEHRKPPATNHSWWQWKMETNRNRDRDTDTRLAELGWTVLRIWEHESVDGALVRILDALTKNQMPSDRLKGHQHLGAASD